MLHSSNQFHQSFNTNCRRGATLAGIVLLVLPLLIILSVSEPRWRVHPVLLKLAEQQPERVVRVIVQKTTNDRSLGERVTQLGGVVINELPIINAFTAALPAQTLPKLALAEGVKWVSLDAPTVKAGGVDGTVSTTSLINTYNRAVRADQVWAQGYQGSSVTVAIVDSGVHYMHADFGKRVQTQVIFNAEYLGVTTPIGFDFYGHGTHVAGIVGGDGYVSGRKYIGIAPKVKLIDIKISNDAGQSRTSDVIKGLQWIYDNRVAYNIKVVNLSLNSTFAESYHTNPLSAAAEILWFNGVTVIASAGNNGSATLYPPANDPFVITVGATDDKGTTSLSDDVVASFSAYGTTQEGFAKPDLVAPGKNIVSTMVNAGTMLRMQHSANAVGIYYFRMSGTSMAAPMAAGAAALLLQSNPNLTPDQVKYRLKATANKNWAGYSSTKAGAGYLDVYAAVKGTTTQAANTSIRASNLLWSGLNPVTWGSVDWNSVDWNSVDWNSVDWNSVDWNSVDWNSDYWGN